MPHTNIKFHSFPKKPLCNCAVCTYIKSYNRVLSCSKASLVFLPGSVRVEEGGQERCYLRASFTCVYEDQPPWLLPKYTIYN